MGEGNEGQMPCASEIRKTLYDRPHLADPGRMKPRRSGLAGRLEYLWLQLFSDGADFNCC